MTMVIPSVFDIPPPPSDCSPASYFKDSVMTACSRKKELHPLPQQCVGASRKRSRSKSVGFAPLPSKSGGQQSMMRSCDGQYSTWYSPTDYAAIAKQVKSDVRKLRKRRKLAPNNNNENDEVCSRGLEKYECKPYHDEKKNREQNHYRTLFLEQKRQRMVGVPNEKILRMISTITSQWAVQNAVALARDDEKEAMRLQNDPEVTPLSECFLHFFDVDQQQQVAFQPGHEVVIESFMNGSGSDSETEDIKLSPLPTMGKEDGRWNF